MKRTFLSMSVALAAVLLAPSGAFAAGGLDYAKSVGQVEMGDTINYVIEATSDGGYVAGGQTIQCLRRKKSQVVAPDSSGDMGVLAEPVAGTIEVVPMSECEEYYADDDFDLENINDSHEEAGTLGGRAALNTKLTTGSDFSISNICGSGTQSPSYGGRGGDSVLQPTEYDPGSEYRVSCVDYIAKFKKDGTKEWLTTIMDNVVPVAVGETTNDYRLLTMRGSLYTFAKANGEKSLSSQINVNRIYDAIINSDGTTTTYDSRNGIAIYNANGSLRKTLPDSGDETSYEGYYVDNAPITKALVRTSDGGFLAFYEKTQMDDDDNWIGTGAIVKVSADLNTITPIAEYSSDDLEESNIDYITILSADQDDNVMLILDEYDAETDKSIYYIAVINKSGELVEMKEVNDVFGVSSEDEEFPLFLDDFTVVNPKSSKLMRLSSTLEETDSYDMGEGEMIYDVVVLKDKSLAGVGRASTSTANYTVDGGVNGIYFRLAAKSSNNGAINPNTADDFNTYAIGGGIAAVVITGAAVLAGKRR